MAEIDELPHIISFPRSGSHWIHCVLELALERRRVFRPHFGQVQNNPISFLPPETPQEPAWVHAHTANDHSAIQKVIYLYRDPVDTIFSMKNTMPKGINIPVSNMMQRWIAHVSDWCYSNITAATIFRYETVVVHPRESIKQFIIAMDMSMPNDQKVDDALAYVTKERLAENGRPGMVTHFSPTLLSEEYKEERSLWRKKYARQIYGQMMPIMREQLFPEL